jgi:hypothetical protein
LPSQDTSFDQGIEVTKERGQRGQSYRTSSLIGGKQTNAPIGCSLRSVEVRHSVLSLF